jgi:hypothetical protein
MQPTWPPPYTIPQPRGRALARPRRAVCRKTCRGPRSTRRRRRRARLRGLQRLTRSSARGRERSHTRRARAAAPRRGSRNIASASAKPSMPPEPSSARSSAADRRRPIACDPRDRDGDAGALQALDQRRSFPYRRRRAPKRRPRRALFGGRQDVARFQAPGCRFAIPGRVRPRRRRGRGSGMSGAWSSATQLAVDERVADREGRRE